MEPEKTSRKSYWGHGIVAVYATFALATLSFVAFTMTQKVELVANDYYSQEIGYEQQINRVRQTKELAIQVTCELSADGKFIQLQWPPKSGAMHGTIMLYRPSDSALDRELELAPDTVGMQRLPTAKLTPGMWRIKVTWSLAGRDFYNEFTVKV